MRRNAIRLWGAALALLVCTASAAAQPRVTAAELTPEPRNYNPGGLPPVQSNVDLVGKLDVDGHDFGDVSYYRGFAYLNAWSEADQCNAGTYAVDISNPAAPRQVGFIPASPETYHGEGVHVLTLSTPQFTGDVLAVSNERCNSAGEGGFDLYDVSDPANPVLLTGGYGDFGGEGSLTGTDAANSYHSIFVWQTRGRAYAAGVDNEEFHDVDIFDITDPRNPQPIREFALADEFDVLGGLPPYLPLVFTRDVIVKEVGGRQQMLVSYWDAGYVQLDVTDPANPQFVADSDFPATDPLVGGLRPEGNAHSATFSWDGKFIVAADEDFNPYRAGDVQVTTGPSTGTYPAAELPFAGHSIGSLPDHVLNGPTVYGGYGCPDVVNRDTVFPTPLPPGEEATVVLVPGMCENAVKIENAEAAGYDAVIVISSFSFPYCFGAPPDVDLPSVCATNAALQPLFGSTTPPTGDIGEQITDTAVFDGWGYAHLYRSGADPLQEVDSAAITEALGAQLAYGSGDLSLHEFATDPTEYLAYASYHSAGLRVFSFGDAGLTEQGAFVESPKTNFWGIEQFTTPGGERLIATSDRDFGLYIFRYTGPGAARPPVCPDSSTSVPFRSSATLSLPCSDANNNPLTRQILTNPSRGTLGPVDQGQGTVPYTDSGDRIGTDSFTFRAGDGAASSATATVRVSITPRDSGPCFNRFVSSTAELDGSEFGDELNGSDRNERLRGHGGDDCVLGLGGDDHLDGGTGADRLEGGDGNDILIGGPGRDVFSGGTGNDRIEARDSSVDEVACGAGRDVVATADPGDRIAGDCEQKPKVAKAACRCSTLSVETYGWGDATARGNPRTAFGFRVRWRMRCTGGSGACQGRIEVVKPAGTDFKLSAPKKQPVQCKGTCKGKGTSQGMFRVAGTSARSLDQDTRGGKRFKFSIKRYCLRNGKLVRVGSSSMTVAYGPSGRLEKSKSDLDGDGKPDRRKPKKR